MHIDLTALGLTADTEAAIMGAAATVAASKATLKKPRKTLTSEAWEAAKAGVLPPTPSIPMSNFHAQKKADLMQRMAADGDKIALGNMVIGGTNTYSKALRDYQTALLHYLDALPQPAPVEDTAVELDFTKAKKAAAKSKSKAKQAA